MNNKYISRLTDKDIENILKKCGFSLAKPFLNKRDEMIEPIERFDNKSDKILVRCIAPNILDEFSGLFKSISDANPNLAIKLMYLTALTQNTSSTSSVPSNLDLLIIEDFSAYFPVETDDECKKSIKIHQAYINYCAEKFGEQYINDYIESKKELLKENDNTKENDL